jgi:nitrogen regulatory protein P-II 2
MSETAKVRLVTVIAAFETEERLLKDLKSLGVKGFTLGKVDGRGLHGPRMSGLTDAPNMHVEMLVTAALATRILDRIVARYADQPVLAFVQDVEAVPAEHFE